MPELVINKTYCGPPESANGGYVCGRIAASLPGPAEVTLHVPPPLDHPMRLVDDGAGSVAVYDGETLVADAHSAQPDIAPHPWVSPELAHRASERYAWADPHVHPYPTCFVCGSARTTPDSMHVFAGPVPGLEPLHASPWTPQAPFLDGDGQVLPEFIWAALDCPGGHATNAFDHGGRVLLGRFTVELLHPVAGDQEYVVTASPLRRDGRKIFTSTALRSASGELLAHGAAIWIVVAQ
ncbi:MAG: PaaI family thioesterase [Solirubrobacteraceae bacterium]